MDKETKNEFEKLAIMVKNGFDQTASKEELEGVKNDLRGVKKNLEATKKDLGGKINKFKRDLEEKIDEVSAKLQDQKNVPLVRKVDEKLDKEIEIHGKNKTLSQKDIEEIKDLNPFPSKPAITS